MSGGGKPERDAFAAAAAQAFAGDDFRKWYGGHAQKLGLDPNPDSPLHFYDWRAAYAVDAEPDKDGHWPSEFKQVGHPALIVDGVDTRTGQPATRETQDSSRTARVARDPIAAAAAAAFEPEHPPAGARTAGPLGVPVPDVAISQDITALKPAHGPMREIRALPEPGAIKRAGHAALTTAAESFNFGQKPIPSPQHERERMAARIEAGNIKVTPEDLETDLATQIGELIGSAVDPTLAIPFVGGEKLAFTAIEKLATKGVPIARRLVELSRIPEGATLARRALARAVRAATTAGTGTVAAAATETLGHEGRLPTAGEAAGAFAAGTVAGPVLAAGGEVVASGIRRGLSALTSAPKMEAAAPTTPPVAAQPVPVPAAEPAPTIRERIADVINPQGAQERRAAVRAAETDALTGLGNQRAWEKARAAADADANTEVIAFDLNNLKAANDVLGHEQGNALIQRAATAVQQASGRGFRIGGDEMLAVAPRGKGEAIRQAVERAVGETPVTLPDGRTVMASISGSVGPDYAAADAGLQAAKRARKGPGGSARGPGPTHDPAYEHAARSFLDAGEDPLGGLKKAYPDAPVEQLQEAIVYAQAGLRRHAPEVTPPAGIVRMKLADIGFDPKRFQFRSVGESGITDELKDVKVWNDKLGGVISLWIDPADGKPYIVNGHHRYELAKRLGVDELNVQFVEAADVKAARAEGAFINIAEGRGTATDVAKFLRDYDGASVADLESRGVSLRGNVARDGMALSKLASDVFDQVATAKVPQGWGVAIGSLLDDPVLQRDALKAAMGSRKRLTQAEVTEIARQVRDAGTEVVNQETLFGTETERHGLFVQIAQLAMTIKQRLAGDKRLFGYVAKEGRAEGLSRAGETKIDVDAARGLAEGSAKAEEVFNRLYTRSGPIADIMREAAGRVTRGEKSGAVVTDIYPAIGDAVARELETARPHGGERPVSPAPRSVADEIAAEDAAREGRVADSTDPSQAGFFSPARPKKPSPAAEPPAPPAGQEHGVPHVARETHVRAPEDQASLLAATRQDLDRAAAEGLANEQAIREGKALHEKGPADTPETEVFLPLSEQRRLGIDTPSATRAEIALAEQRLREGGQPSGPGSVEESARRVAGQGELDDITGKRLGFDANQVEGINELLSHVSLRGEELAHLRRLAADLPAGTRIEVLDRPGYKGQKGQVVSPAEVAESNKLGMEPKAYEKFLNEERAGLGGGHYRLVQMDDGGVVWFHPDELKLSSPAPSERAAPALTPEPVGPAQTELLGAKEGTMASRSLQQTEAAARDDLEKLRVQFKGEKDATRRQEIARQIAEHQKLLNRDKAVTAEELAARAAAEKPVGGTVEPETDQADLFGARGPDTAELYSPATRRSPLGAAVRKATGQAPISTAAHEEVKTLAEISRTLAEAVGVPLRQGRFQAGLRKALGVFKSQEEVARVVRFDKLDTVAHEVGHFLSKKYLKNPTTKGGGGRTPVPLPQGANQELLQLGKDLYGSRKPAGGYGEEGIAEWVSHYVTDPATNQQKAPIFSAYMDKVLANEPALRAALDQARADVAHYQKVPAAARVGAMISVKPEVRQLPSLTDIVRSVVDDQIDWKRAVEELGGAKSPDKDAYTLARMTRGINGIAEEMLERGVTTFGTTDRVAGSPLKALKAIPVARRQALREYLVAESAIERLKNGIDPGFTMKDATEVADAGREEFQEVAKVLWQHYQALIDYRRDAGLLTEAEANLIKSKNQRHVAFYRVFEPEETAKSGGSGRPFGRGGSGVKRQTGSARPVIDPLESLIRDTYETVTQAQRHDVMTTLVRMANATEGGGKVVERVAPPQQAVRINVDKVRDQLEALGFTVEEGAEADDAIGGLLVAFQERHLPGAAEAKDLVVPLLEGGERHWYAINDKTLYDAAQGMVRPEMTALQRWLSLPTRTLRAGATLTLEFIGRNPVRDAWSSAVYSKAGTRPPGWRLAQGLFHYLKADDVFQRWKLAGGDNATQLGLDRVVQQKHLDRLLATKGQKLWNVVRHPVDQLRLASSVMENASRIGEYGAVERQAGARGATARAANIEGGAASRDITQDFAMAGTAGRQINGLVAFFNAQVGAAEKLLREHRTRPGTVIPRALAMITVPSVTLYLMQKDDPAYQEVPRWVKDASWVYVQRGPDRGEGWDGYGTGKVEHVWMLPKPFELGVVYGTVPERIAEWVHTNDPQVLDAMTDAITKAFTPNLWPTFAQPLVENYANRSKFRDRPIVPRGKEALDPAEQVAPRTGETARLAGKAIGYSPAKIENLLRGYGGGLAAYLTTATDAAIRTTRELSGAPPLKAPERESGHLLPSVPLVKAFVREPPAEDAESVEQLYQRFEAAETRRRTWRSMLNDGRHEEARAYLTKHRDEIRSVATVDESGGPGPLRVAHQKLQDLQNAKRRLEKQGPEAVERRDRVVRAMRKVAGSVKPRRARPAPSKPRAEGTRTTNVRVVARDDFGQPTDYEVTERS